MIFRRTKRILAFCAAGCVSISSIFGQSVEKYREYLEKWEGRKTKPYYCKNGFLTVGIGHKLKPTDKKKREYSQKDIDELFESDLSESVKISKTLVPNFDKLPERIKLVIVSMAFNVGATGLAKFKKFITHISNNNFSRAAGELKDSLWFRQVQQSRAQDHFNRILAGAT